MVGDAAVEALTKSCSFRTKEDSYGCEVDGVVVVVVVVGGRVARNVVVVVGVVVVGFESLVVASVKADAVVNARAVVCTIRDRIESDS